MKLFAIYIGGEMAGANIELHDMRFVAAGHIDQTHDELRRQWWGTPDTLHIDCWAELIHADGYAITLKPEPADQAMKLFYVNLGGYEPSDFTEQHKNMFVVAENASKAKIRALKTVRHWDAFHKDNLYEAEQCLSISDELACKKIYIHLEKIGHEDAPPFTCYYNPIGKKAVR